MRDSTDTISSCKVLLDFLGPGVSNMDLFAFHDGVLAMQCNARVFALWLLGCVMRKSRVYSVQSTLFFILIKRSSV
jgi:hypothetical protein